MYLTAAAQPPTFTLPRLQCLTNDAWSGLMTDAMIGPESEMCTEEAGNCGSWVAVPYFISFQVVHYPS